MEQTSKYRELLVFGGPTRFQVRFGFCVGGSFGSRGLIWPREDWESHRRADHALRIRLIVLASRQVFECSPWKDSFIISYSGHTG